MDWADAKDAAKNATAASLAEVLKDFAVMLNLFLSFEQNGIMLNSHPVRHGRRGPRQGIAEILQKNCRQFQIIRFVSEKIPALRNIFRFILSRRAAVEAYRVEGPT